ncbi:acyl-CoA dehydrogenase [Desulfonema ishimotonii]|uniref:acyl-CoA dehydrogenase n=1 Tax=Desulfonema ishimotonii TaxID=45657 RepID=UPI001E5A8EF6|nr:acyl-CoA dehydrogenase family protein [Desulfonema ishimotonii]
MDSQGGAVSGGLDAESRQMVVDTVRQLRKRLLTREKVLEFDKKEIFPEDVVREMLGPEIGLQLLFIPEEYGGMGGGARDCHEVIREMCKICLGVGTAFFAVQLGADPVLVGATEAQKEKWLGAIAEGNTLVGYAVTEANAGSNLAALRTKAEPVTDSDGNVTGYTINGTKQFISNGGYADYVTVLANTPEGPSFFIVEKGTPGFVQGKGEEKHGIRASNTSPLSFTDVVVPVGNLIGGVPGQGLKQANQVFGYTRLMVASMALGTVENAMEIAIAYARERIQFGSPLSEKQGYTHKLIVPHAVRLAAANAYIEDIAHRLDSGEAELQVEGSMGKLFTTEAANNAADACVQALGGYGYINEYEVEKIRRDVKITCIYEGTSEVQQNIVSTFRWKKTRKTKGAFYNAIAEEMASLHAEHDNIGARFYGLAAKALNVLIDRVHEKRLVRQQHVMFVLADTMTWVEVGASMARKAARLTGAGDARAEEFRAMSRIFANEVSQTVVRNSLNILSGSGAFGPDVLGDFMAETSCDGLTDSYRNVIQDMDKVTDILFER